VNRIRNPVREAQAPGGALRARAGSAQNGGCQPLAVTWEDLVTKPNLHAQGLLVFARRRPGAAGASLRRLLEDRALH
jgi:hypothetical protein